ncbi:MAG: hypothetical protein PWR01_3231 [Clostridiales bacterium]|jgi:2-hydroxychromene-2-carboxylate isomerase|nr:hypothetical protein [Clostridiales bacterium]MDN5282158.1 hypothetical protein [Candidatus Ozemobacter sp.]
MTWEMLKTMLKNKQITVCPIEVGLFPPGNTKFHFREIWGDPRWNRLIQDADKLGLRISKLDKYVSSLFVSRAIEAYGSASAEDYISSVFRGVFLTGINISLPNSVRMHLQSEGLDSSIFATAIENPATEKKALDHQLLWGSKRLRQVPTLEYDSERYSGFMDSIGLERYLRAIVD